MPREFLIKMTADPALTGHPVGTVLRRFSIDCDEYEAKKLGVVIDTDPPPREYLLTNGLVDVGVMAGSQTKMTPEQKAAEQTFLLDQVKNLDQRHEAEVAKKAAADALVNKRKETAHE